MLEFITKTIQLRNCSLKLTDNNIKKRSLKFASNITSVIAKGPAKIYRQLKTIQKTLPR